MARRTIISLKSVAKTRRASEPNHAPPHEPVPAAAQSLPHLITAAPHPRHATSSVSTRDLRSRGRRLKLALHHLVTCFRSTRDLRCRGRHLKPSLLHLGASLHHSPSLPLLHRLLLGVLLAAWVWTLSVSSVRGHLSFIERRVARSRSLGLPSPPKLSWDRPWAHLVLVHPR